ncbi:MAG: hypothetical protein U0105_17145 [Candidatus Obscuribacterales bacterium]
MNKKFLITLIASALTMGAALPTFADDSSLDDFASLAGTSTALVIDVPQAMIVDTLWWSPLHAQRSLAGHFGDDKGLTQNVAAFVLGVPWGMVWGIPSGALRGAKHACSSGWEKPFSTESFMVINQEESSK